MTGAERGFLLLCAELGDPNRRPLTQAQLRTLSRRVRQMPKSDPQELLTQRELLAMGYGKPMAEKVLALLGDDALLTHYLHRANACGCYPITRASAAYPDELRRNMADDAPGCFWAKGDLQLLTMRKIALVGSRDLEPENRLFAEEVGYQAARQGYALVSGNARGADRAAQEACLQNGGKVISVVAECLKELPDRENVLYLSEECYDKPFSAQRALSRNLVIHALPEKTFVAQCTLGHGGTWDGTVKNLRRRYSAVYCCPDGSPAVEQLVQMGAQTVSLEKLSALEKLPELDRGFLE